MRDFTSCHKVSPTRFLTIKRIKRSLRLLMQYRTSSRKSQRSCLCRNDRYVGSNRLYRTNHRVIAGRRHFASSGPWLRCARTRQTIVDGQQLHAEGTVALPFADANHDRSRDEEKAKRSRRDKGELRRLRAMGITNLQSWELYLHIQKTGAAARVKASRTRISVYEPIPTTRPHDEAIECGTPRGGRTDDP